MEKEKKSDVLDLCGVIDKETLLHYTEQSLSELWEIHSYMAFESKISPVVVDLFNGVSSTLLIIKRLAEN